MSARAAGRVLLAASAALVLAGCGGAGTAGEGAAGSAPGTAGPTGADPTDAGKAWVVDTSGWWLPGDPSGCGTETVACRQDAWPTRAYVKGGITRAVFVHGETITLHCKAPTPVPIRNSMKVESRYWYYSDYEGTPYWVPDIYVTKDQVAPMAEGVPDCPSSTPGING